MLLPSAERSAVVWSPPGAPKLNAVKGVSTGISPTWTALAATGGMTITGYRISAVNAVGEGHAVERALRQARALICTVPRALPSA
jgi:hypothetical protein